MCQATPAEGFAPAIHSVQNALPQRLHNCSLYLVQKAAHVFSVSPPPTTLSKAARACMCTHICDFLLLTTFYHCFGPLAVYWRQLLFVHKRQFLNIQEFSKLVVKV